MSEFIEKYVGKIAPVRASIVITTQLMIKLQSIQNLSPVASIALGRALSGALLLASNTKAGHKVGLQFKGAGPLGNIYAEADYSGNCRGCVGNPNLVMDNPEDNFSLKNTLGIGELTVFNNMGDKGMYQGKVLLETSEIGDDLAYFLYQSQQIPSIVSLGVYLDKEGNILGSGGILIELMPGHNEELISLLEQNVSNIKSFSSMLASHFSYDQIINSYLQGIDIMTLNHHQVVHFNCSCSEERVRRSLELLKATEQSNDNEPIVVTCEFCGKRYAVPF